MIHTCVHPWLIQMSLIPLGPAQGMQRDTRHNFPIFLSPTGTVVQKLVLQPAPPKKKVKEYLYINLCQRALRTCTYVRTSCEREKKGGGLALAIGKGSHQEIGNTKIVGSRGRHGTFFRGFVRRV